jgi:hypothetical protein
MGGPLSGLQDTFLNCLYPARQLNRGIYFVYFKRFDNYSGGSAIYPQFNKRNTLSGFGYG